MGLSETPWNLSAYRRQHLLLEFASLKHIRLQGIYAALTSGNHHLWKCVLFVKNGPYASAVLRFRILFPDQYPYELPVVTFDPSTFHPLICVKKAEHDQDDVFTDEAKLPQKQVGLGLLNLAPLFCKISKGKAPNDQKQPLCTAVDVLLFIRSCFDSQQFLDSLEEEDIVNEEAWKAWQAHNQSVKVTSLNKNLEYKDLWQQRMAELKTADVLPEELFEASRDTT